MHNSSETPTVSDQSSDGAPGSTSTSTSTSSDGGVESSSAGSDAPASLGVRAALGALRFYRQALSPLMPSVCRYLPTCSEYSMNSYTRYGVARGSVLTAWRLARCNPWGGSGYDPPTWPPPGLGLLFLRDGSAEVACVLGMAAAVWLLDGLLYG